jgi:hypothetical protein
MWKVLGGRPQRRKLTTCETGKKRFLVFKVNLTISKEQMEIDTISLSGMKS